MEFPGIPEEFRYRAVLEEAKKFIYPASPGGIFINPANQKTITGAWLRRSDRNSKEILKTLRRKQLTGEAAEKAALMLKSAATVTRTEFGIFAEADNAAKIGYMHRLAALRIGSDYFARHPEILAAELLNPEPTPPPDGKTGVMARLNTPMTTMAGAETGTDLTRLPAPVILAWQGTMTGLISADEDPGRRELHLNVAAAWNRLGGELWRQKSGETTE